MILAIADTGISLLISVSMLQSAERNQILSLSMGDRVTDPVTFRQHEHGESVRGKKEPPVVHRMDIRQFQLNAKETYDVILVILHRNTI